jgi:hypothetical protein
MPKLQTKLTAILRQLAVPAIPTLKSDCARLADDLGQSVQMLSFSFVRCPLMRKLSRIFGFSLAH